MMVKRSYPILCMVLVFTMLLAACAPAQSTSAPQQPAPQSGQPQTLRVWIGWGDNPAQLQGLFDKYGAANNVKVEVTAPVEDDKVLAALTGSEPPDILVLGGGDSVKSWDKEGLVEP